MLTWKWGKPLNADYSNQPQKGYSEITPDAGIPFRRVNFTDIGDLVTCKFTLSKSDYIRFMSWYKYELRQGTEVFKFPDCRYGVERTARIVGDVPQYNTNSLYYDLTLTFYLQPEVLDVDVYLVVNENDGLIVNNNDFICATERLRA